MRIIDNQKTIETNFNSLNNLHVLSAKSKVELAKTNNHVSSVFLFENQFEKEKIYNSTSLQHFVEEKHLKIQILKDAIFSKSLASINSKEANTILLCVGLKSLVLSYNKFGNVKNGHFLSSGKKNCLQNIEAFWGSVISKSVYRENLYKHKILKGVVKKSNLKKLKKNLLFYHSKRVLNAVVKVSFTHLQVFKRRFAKSGKASVKKLGSLNGRTKKGFKAKVLVKEKKVKFAIKPKVKKFKSKKNLRRKNKNKNKKSQFRLRKRSSSKLDWKQKRLRLRKWRRFVFLNHYEINLKTLSFVHLGHSDGKSLAYKSFFPLHISKFFNKLIL